MFKYYTFLDINLSTKLYLKLLELSLVSFYSMCIVLRGHNKNTGVRTIQFVRTKESISVPPLSVSYCKTCSESSPPTQDFNIIQYTTLHYTTPNYINYSAIEYTALR